MRLQRTIRRFAAILFSIVLLCGAFPLSAAAETGPAGLPEGGVVSEIRTTICTVPSAAQMAWLRTDAGEKTPGGCDFYGWVISDDFVSASLSDGELEGFLHAVYDGLAEGQTVKLVLQYLYIPREEALDASQETAAKASDAEDHSPEEPTAQGEDPYPTVPQYFQNDYPYTMYGSGTIASSGCGVTALAMVATYMTGHEYLPDELAHYFGGRAVNNIDRLEYGSKAMQLPFWKAENWHETYRALQEGKVAIVLMDQNSIFTNSQHFIVLTGLNEDGRIMVNDPNRDNYSFWQLKNAFVKGFAEGDMLPGYSGAWIYDKSAMPEEPFLYHEEEPVRGEPRYPDIQLTQAEVELLAKVVWVEAQGECAEGQQAVAEVALNRIASGDFPNNLHDVIYGEGQFRSVARLDEAEPFQAQYEAIENAIYGPYVLPEDVVYFATAPTNDNIWGQIGGHIFCYGAH